MQISPVTRFAWRVVFWLPICFAIWYYMAGVIALPVNLLTDWLMTGLFPDLIREVTPNRHFLDIVCAFTPPAQPGLIVPEGQVAELVFSINSLIYGYSIPLYSALILASPGDEMQKWFRWIIGFLVLSLIQVWGISFDILKTMLFGMGREVNQLLNFSQMQKEGVALGYQLGYLVLPAVTPLILWIGFHRDFLQELIEKTDD